MGDFRFRFLGVASIQQRTGILPTRWMVHELVVGACFSALCAAHSLVRSIHTHKRHETSSTMISLPSRMACAILLFVSPLARAQHNLARQLLDFRDLNLTNRSRRRRLDRSSHSTSKCLGMDPIWRISDRKRAAGGNNFMVIL